MGRVLSFAMMIVVVKIFFPELTGLITEFIATIFEIMLHGLGELNGAFSSLPIR